MTAIGPLFSQLDSTSRPGALTNNSIATDFDRFLNLLTVQLQNQDPLAPMDANQFTQQIVQMTQVEQTVSMNQRLGSLIDAQETQRIQSAVEFVGKEIDAFGSTIRSARLAQTCSTIWRARPVKSIWILSTLRTPTQTVM